jgi:hypothetical protein
VPLPHRIILDNLLKGVVLYKIRFICQTHALTWKERRMGMDYFRNKMCFVNILTAAAMLFLSVSGNVYAAMLDTHQLIDAEQFVQDRLQLIEQLNRTDIQYKLIDLGIDPQSAINRVANLTDSEVQALLENMETAPAGGSALGTVALVFIVLLFTDIAGYTDIFPFVKKNKK